MKNIFKVLLEIIMDTIYGVGYFLKSNLRTFANLINIGCPYLMYIFGFKSEVLGWEVFVPIIAMFIIYFLRSLANKLGSGDSVPVPTKRFTIVQEDGEVNIENSRIQELILYMADLEDYLERKGFL